MKWTSDQQKVISAREGNLLVSAAAGSGKTAVLVERILQMITDPEHPVDVDALLVVTFTNAAASQMREKINSALHKKQEENPTDAHLIKQLSLIHQASITTIDSFCLQVVRENFQQLGLDPGFRIAEAGELSALADDALAAVLEQRYGENDQAFFDFAACYGNDKSDTAIEQYIKNIAMVAASYPRPYAWIRKAKQALNISDIQQMEKLSWYRHMTAGVRAMVETYIQDAAYTESICRGVGGPENFAATCVSDINLMQGALKADSYEDFQKVFSEKFARAASIKAGSCDPEKAELVKKLRNQYKEGFLRLQHFSAPKEVLLQEFEVIRGHMQLLLSLTEDYMQLLDEKKLAESMLDFSDVEHYALKILVDENGPTDIAKQYQNRYKEVLIDEYQDSNFLQEEILTSISTMGCPEGRMFMVGDVKQSIYKFRMARPDLFMDKYQKYQMMPEPAEILRRGRLECGERESGVGASHQEQSYKIDLQSNFRSRAVVLEAVNYIFYQIMGEDLGGIAYDENAALVPGFPFPEAADQSVSTSTELMILDMKPYGIKGDGQEPASEAEGENAAAPMEDEEKQEMDKIEQEARMVLQRIREITGMQGNQPLYVLDENGTTYRKAEFRDIAILFRSMKHMAPVFVKVLSDAGVPVASELTEGLFATQEIKTLMSCLWIIHNPYIDIELAAVLHGPMFSFTSEEMGQIRIEAENLMKACHCDISSDMCFYDALLLSKTKKAQSFLNVLSSWQEKSRYMDVAGLLWEILMQTKYLDYLKALEGGKRRIANVYYLIACARQYAATGKYSVSDFLKYIEQMQDAQLDLGEANVHGEHDNIVRIMSMHKSKGLEFPVVFASGLGRQFNQMDSRERIIVHPDDFLAADYAVSNQRLKKNTFMHMAFAENIKTENIAEEFRVFYVALTRAREKLILTGNTKDFAGMIDSYAKVSRVSDRALPFGYRRSAKTYMDWVIMSLIRNPQFHDMVADVLPGMGRMRRCEYQLDKCELPGAFDLRIMVYREADLELLDAEEKAERLLNTANYFYLQQAPVDDMLFAQLKTQLSYAYPYAELAQKKGKYSVTELKAAGGRESDILMTDQTEGPEMWPEWEEQETKGESAVRTIPLFMQDSVKMDGANRGTLIHRILHMLDFSRCGDRTFIEASLLQWVQEGILPKDVMDYVDINELTAFFESSLGRQMIEAEIQDVLYKEKQFTILVPLSELGDVPPCLRTSSGDTMEELGQEPILVQGIIDAYFINADGNIVVVDYKTDRGELPMEQYRMQLKYYAKTLERLTHKKVEACYVYALTKKSAIPV